MGLEHDLRKYAEDYEMLHTTLDSGGARIVDVLRALCEQRTQKDVAKSLGITTAYMSDIVNGRRPMCRALNKRLLKATGRRIGATAD